jgi:hypothetical protein
MSKLAPHYFYASQGLSTISLTPLINSIAYILGIWQSFLFVIMWILGIFGSSKNTENTAGVSGPALENMRKYYPKTNAWSFNGEKVKSRFPNKFPTHKGTKWIAWTSGYVVDLTYLNMGMFL